MLHTKATLTALAMVSAVAVASGQMAAAPEPGPKVGDVAPDFTLRGATKDGVLQSPVSLAKLRGQTVVVAFFPKARTSGCTAQMTRYRDRWAGMFNGGKGIAVISISVDADTTQANWAREANLPMTFGSDVGGAVGKAYGAYNGKTEIRLLYVIDPDGKIAFTMKPFNPMVEDSYADLGVAIKKLSGTR